MAYRITEECKNCGDCAAVCPGEAITEGDEIYVIDEDSCLDCGQCAEVCKNDAIVMD